jgi:hypothetical protein
LRGAIHDIGDEAVIKSKPLQVPVGGGFTIDEQAGTIVCPAGYIRPLSRTRVASFGAACRNCPLREQCTKSKIGRKIVVHQRDNLLRRTRSDWADELGQRQEYERAISQIASRSGRRLKLRYRGAAKSNAWLSRCTAGLNPRSPIRCGLTRTTALWALAPVTA